MYKIFFSTLFIISFSLLKAENLPTNYFSWPVKHEIRLSGTFGELRSNHFHGGLDIKSAHGVEGDKLYSAANGYIEKISVQPHGYGNALYIKHPNGYTTVYGHMRSFSKEIEDFVKEYQYKEERFSQTLPKSGRKSARPVKRKLGKARKKSDKVKQSVKRKR